MKLGFDTSLSTREDEVDSSLLGGWKCGDGGDLCLRIDQIRLCEFSKLEFSSYFKVPVLLYLQLYHKNSPGYKSISHLGFLHV